MIIFPQTLHLRLNLCPMTRKMMSEHDLPKKVFLTRILELPCGGRRQLQSARLTYATLPKRFVCQHLGMIEDLDAAEQCLHNFEMELD